MLIFYKVQHRRTDIRLSVFLGGADLDHSSVGSSLKYAEFRLPSVAADAWKGPPFPDDCQESPERDPSSVYHAARVLSRLRHQMAGRLFSA